MRACVRVCVSVCFVLGSWQTIVRVPNTGIECGFVSKGKFLIAVVPDVSMVREPTSLFPYYISLSLSLSFSGSLLCGDLGGRNCRPVLVLVDAGDA